MTADQEQNTAVSGIVKATILASHNIMEDDESIIINFNAIQLNCDQLVLEAIN